MDSGITSGGDRRPNPSPTTPDRVGTTKPEVIKEIPSPSKRNLRKERNPNGNGKIGFRDIDSKELVIDYLYDNVVPFKGVSTFVKQGNKWALIDKNGQYLVNFRIKQPGIFRNGYAEIIPEGRNRVIKINHAGEVEIKGVFYKLEEVLDNRNN